ncbi:hypothetical protein Barb6_03018 [Bacteroidales bacterium Barb6]|nr:hypothetical protein Barb6_03018 [Bacteroidales bacterium Barb6]
MPRRGKRFQPHMERRLKGDNDKGVLKGRPNNVCLKSSFAVVSPFQGSIGVYLSEPHIPLRSMWG